MARVWLGHVGRTQRTRSAATKKFRNKKNFSPNYLSIL